MTDRIDAAIKALQEQIKPLNKTYDRLHKDFMDRLEVDGKLRRTAGLALAKFAESGDLADAQAYQAALVPLREAEAITKEIDRQRWEVIEQTKPLSQREGKLRQLRDSLQDWEAIKDEVERLLG